MHYVPYFFRINPFLGQVTTTNGSLRIRIEQADPASNHGLSYKSGMLQSWNKLCFTGGYIEGASYLLAFHRLLTVAPVSVSFPGSSSNVAGYVSAILLPVYDIQWFISSGLASGLWETWDGRGMERLQMVYGHTRASFLFLTLTAR